MQPSFPTRCSATRCCSGWTMRSPNRSRWGSRGAAVNFDSFSDGYVDPALLRSHPSNLRRDLSEPVSGGLKTDDMGMFGVSVNLKYHFSF